MDWGLIAAGVLIAIGQWLKSRSRTQTLDRVEPPEIARKPIPEQTWVSPTVPREAPETGSERARALRNNNPGNIRWNPNNNWQGQTGQDSAGFVIFNSPLYGLRAIFKILNTYRSRYGVSTVRDIIYRWAPPNENDTQAYVDYVTQQTGLGQNRHIRTRGDAVALVRAMVTLEAGSDPYQTALYGQAYDLANA